MKKKLLLLAAVSLSWLGVNAQWVKPEVKSLEPAEVATQGTLVRIYNVEYGAFLGGANAWGTQTSLLAEGLDYKLEWSDDGKNFKLLTSSGAKSGKYLFRDNTSGCFIDMGTQNRGFNWTIALGENGFYTIQSPIDDPVYGVGSDPEAPTNPNWANEFFGWNGDKNIVYANVNPDGTYLDEEGEVQKYAGFGISWAFMTQEDATALVEALKPYNAAMALKKVIDQAKADYPEVDCSKAEAVYNNTNSTVEELKAAEKLVANAIAAIHTAKVLDGATEKSPKDGTELIVNADFSAGDISGWECTFVSGTTATNVGYQGAAYPRDGVTPVYWEDEDTNESGESRIGQFIEAWANNVNEMKRDGKSFATIGDAKLCQTIYGMPAGKYKLSCDAIAVQQWDGSQNPVTGVQLYVLGGDIDSHENIASENELPNHAILTFIHTGGDLELGLRTQGATANWIAADNFTLKYYGPITKNAFQILLEECVAKVNKQYVEGLDDIVASAAVKAALEEAYKAAVDAEDGKDDDYYKDLQASLETAVSGLDASVAAYKKIAATIDEAEERMNECSESWGELAGQISDALSGWREKFDNLEYETGDEVTIDAELNDLIANYISENVKAGDDVTILLKNAGFKSNFSGWAVTGTSPVWAANHAQGANNSEYASSCAEDAIPAEADGLAERYQAVFSMSQTIKNMPRGLYQLSCQGFNRKDGDGKPAELYAILPDGSEQTTPFCDIAAYQTATSLYQLENGNDGWPADNVNGNGYYQPNGMSGAAWHFMHKSDGENFDYTNKFNIVLKEQGDITLGARCDNAKQWVIFDTFKITYLGSGSATYAEPINQLIARGDKALEDGMLYKDNEICGASQEVVDAWGSLAKQGVDAYTNGTEDDCIAALDTLEKYLKNIDASVALAKKLFDAYVFNTEVRLSVTDSEIASGVCDEVYEKLLGDGYDTDAEMEAAIIAMDAAFCDAALAEVEDEMKSATEDEPVAIPGIIANATFNMNGNGYDCWTTTGKAPHGYFANTDEEGNSYNLAEVWNGSFTLTQKVYNMPAGYYRLKVQAFQRNAGFNKHSADAAIDSIGEPLPAKLVVGNASTPIASLFSEVGNYEGEGAAVSGGKYDGVVVPNSMAQAADAFNAGLYQNILQFQVTEAAEVKAFASQVAGVKDCIELGIVKETNQDDAWVIWGQLNIEYLGKTEPSTDPTTAVQNVVSPIVAAQYFNINGTQQSKLQKGVNIVKVTRANGTSKMVKVLVK
ncbi:MAG: hypothetical protein KBT39_13850 [Bacteroidales bacterium]|nr:hypothetical protein [Bacteroidales bacterium]